ncbi:hypothetical protein EVAR_96892_1 [Eumeta japonica]|uniref:Uncharacterized protein n=1 Tax=Eumeta variegata TaxID=151549 RepID=A0A4C1WCV1_EUMVA|nr:hypothetical protein EVAR_96892_1 [Eumeta japonica]
MQEPKPAHPLSETRTRRAPSVCLTKLQLKAQSIAATTTPGALADDSPRTEHGVAPPAPTAGRLRELCTLHALNISAKGSSRGYDIIESYNSVPKLIRGVVGKYNPSHHYPVQTSRNPNCSDPETDLSSRTLRSQAKFPYLQPLLIRVSLPCTGQRSAPAAGQIRSRGSTLCSPHRPSADRELVTTVVTKLIEDVQGQVAAQFIILSP